MGGRVVDGLKVHKKIGGGSDGQAGINPGPHTMDADELFLGEFYPGEQIDDYESDAPAIDNAILNTRNGRIRCRKTRAATEPDRGQSIVDLQRGAAIDQRNSRGTSTRGPGHVPRAADAKNDGACNLRTGRCLSPRSGW